jgi:Leucine rich repeat
MPASISALSSLVNLSMELNMLTGSIPTSLGALTNLQTLKLSFNQLSGSIPTSLSALANLQILYMDNNQLTGSIPAGIGLLGQLQILRLGGNQLSGTIPESLSALTNLQDIRLALNRLTGKLPANIGKLPNLQNLDFGNNLLSGCIPSSWSALCGKTVYLSGNFDLPDFGNFSAFCTNGAGACPATPLPVTLRYFNGRMTAAGAVLGWETAREDNNAFFRIERSRDAVSFESIGTVPTLAPGGTAIEPLTYAFTDVQPLPGTNYYRLIQTDRDDTRTPSRIIALAQDGVEPVLFPNPVGTLGEAVLSPPVVFDSYQISNVLGQVVQQSAVPGVLSRVSLAGLPGGVYLLRVQTDSGPRTFRVVR